MVREKLLHYKSSKFCLLLSGFFLAVSIQALPTPTAIPTSTIATPTTAPPSDHCSSVGIRFRSKANIAALNISGNVQNPTADIYLEQGKKTIDRLKISMPVESLTTGLKLRDTHMADRIFKTSEGQFPDLVLELKRPTCPGDKTPCNLKASLKMRGVEKPATLLVSSIETHSKTERPEQIFKGSAMLLLSDYGIEAPKHLGIQVRNEVEVEFEITCPKY